MKQKFRIQYAEPKFAPAGTILPNQIIATDAVDRDVLSVGNSSPTNYALNVLSGLARIRAITNAVFGAFKQNVDKNHSKATGTLTLIGVITPGSHAESVITSDATNVIDDVAATGVLTSDNTEISDGNTVTIGTTVYRFKDTPAQAYDVKRDGTTADTTLGNLVKAVNASGTEGVEYFAGTLIHPTVSAGAVTSHAITFTAKTKGSAGNSIAKSLSATHLDWDGVGAVFTGGKDADTVTIGSTVYRFKDTLAQAYDVKIGATAAASLDNLKAAINASGTAGVEYFAGTLAHPTAVATDNTNTTQKIVARTPGVAANTLATTEVSAHLSWENTTLGGGTGDSNPGVAPETVTIGTTVYSFLDVLSETNGATAIAYQVLFGANSAAALDNLKAAINASGTAGTEYSTGTLAHTQVEATTNADDSQIVQALSSGSLYNAIATTTTIVNGAWGATTLTGGDSATFDFYIPAGEEMDIPIESSVTNLSFIGDGGSATVIIIEY